MHRKHVTNTSCTEDPVANTCVSRRKSTANTRLTPQTYLKDITKAPVFASQKHTQTNFNAANMSERRLVLHRKYTANTSCTANAFVLRRKSAAKTRLTPQTDPKDIAKAPVLHRKYIANTSQTRPAPQTRPFCAEKCLKNPFNAANTPRKTLQKRPFCTEKRRKNPFNAANTSERHCKSARFASQKPAQTHGKWPACFL